MLVTYGIENWTQYQYQTCQQHTRNMMTIMTPICHSYQRLAKPRPQNPGKTEVYLVIKGLFSKNENIIFKYCFDVA